MMKNPFLFFTPIVLLSGCGEHHKQGSFSAHYTQRPLKQFQDSITNIPTGTAINILAYSGGEESKKSDALNYCQFIGIDQATGDTVRILSAAIDVDDAGAGGGPVLTPSTTYDFDKGIRDAIFRSATENDKLMLRMMPGVQGGETDVKKLNADLNGPVTELVMLPDGVPLFARHYKTAVGILSFKQRPW
jgi:hypothetical protein